MYKISLSPYHKIFYNEWKINPYGCKYNIVFDQTLSSSLDLQRLQDALYRFVSDYLLLNSHIVNEDGNLFWIKNSAIKNLEIFKNSYTQEQIYKYVASPFNIEDEPLYRFAIFNELDGNYKFILVYHHLIMDGASVDISISEISKYYNSVSYSTEHLLSVQKNAVESMTVLCDDELYSHDTLYENFWKNQLSGIAPIDLRLFKPINSNKYADINCEHNSIKEFRFAFSKDEILKMRQILRKQGITLYMYSQCIFSILLYRYTNQNKFALSYPIDINCGMDFVCGTKINTNIIPYMFGDKSSISDILDQSKNFIKSLKNSAINYKRYPIDRIIMHSNKDLLNVIFAATNLKDTEFTFFDTKLLEINHDFNIDLVGKLVFEQELKNQMLNFRVKYNSLEIDEGVLKQFIKHYQKLFIEVIEDLEQNNTAKLVSEYQILTNAEYQKIVYDWNKTDKSYPGDKTIHQLFEEQVLKTPDNIAIVYEDTKLTYNELNIKANQLAYYLSHNYEIKPDDLIVLYLDRSEYVLVAILAVLKAGGAYVPIDVSSSVNRIKYVLEDANSKIILCNEVYKNKLSSVIKSMSIIAIDDIQFMNKINQEQKYNPNNKLSSHNLAYIIYTSGTTGNPKGVMIEHRSVVNVLDYLNNIYHKSDDGIMRVTAFTSYVFDVSVSEFFTVLVRGGELHLFSELVRTDPQKIKDYLIENKINYAYLPPVMLARLPKVNYSNLIGIIYAGEPCNHVTAKYWSGQYKLYNLYGPTETCIYVIGKQVLNGDVNLIGRPINNTGVYILSNNLMVMPIGAIGELYITGNGISRGYLNQPDLNKERFIANPFQTQSEKRSGVNGKLYKTGDLARYLPDGNIEYIGRNDTQIKINGYRIELGEIETALCKYSNIRHVVVMPIESRYSSNQLIDTDYGTDMENIRVNTTSIIISEEHINDVNQRYISALLPIQEWFFAQNFSNVNHWNHSFLIKTPKLNKAILVDSIIELTNSHDCFRLRYKYFPDDKETPYQPYYIDKYPDIDYPKGSLRFACDDKYLDKLKTLPFYELDISTIPYQEGTPEFKEYLYRILTDWQSNFDIEQGLLFSFGYIYGYSDGTTRIYVALHHLIIDVVSWNIIVHDLRNIYTKLNEVNEQSLSIDSYTKLDVSNKYTTYQQWVNIVKLYGKYNVNERDFWLNMLYGHKIFDKQLKLLVTSMDNQSQANNTIKFSLDQGSTDSITNKSRLVFENAVNEILLAALAMAIKELLLTNHLDSSNTCDEVYITLEGHGRENIASSADISHTVGWFTTMFPVKLIVANELNIFLKSIHQTLQSIPNHGIGYGALFGYLNILPCIGFNYLGQISHKNSDDLWYITGESSGKRVSAENKNQNIIDVTCWLIDNQLSFTVGGILANDQLNQFADILNSKLNTIIQEIDQRTEFLRDNHISRNKYLAAYYTSDVKLDPVVLRNYLVNLLPHCSVPKSFIHLDEIPLTINGKIDSKSLPIPYFIDSEEYIAPRNEKEQLICQVFAKVLHKNQVGIYDDFFLCGGDSILAITLVMLLQNHFCVNIRDITKFRTPHQLAQSLVLSNNSIKSRLFDIIGSLHKNQDIVKQVDQMLVDNNVQFYHDETKMVIPDISSKQIKNVLLTGATGYLGCNILNQLLTNTNYNIYVLIRADSDALAVERLESKYKLYFSTSLSESDLINYRLFVLRGNIEQDYLGISETRYYQLVNCIDSIIHTAALVKQLGDDDLFYSANVQATINLLYLSKLTRLKDFHYISTSSILKHVNEYDEHWGSYYTENHLPDNLELMENNIYLKTKLEAERQVVKYRKYGVNTNIYRVGNLAFMLKDLSVQDNTKSVGFANWLRYFFQSKYIFADIQVNVSPVDLTANAIVKLFDKQCSTNSIYHVFNPYLFDLVGYMQYTSLLSVKVLPMAEFITHVIKGLDSTDDSEYILRFLLAQGWLEVEGIYQFAQRKYLQDRTRYILRFLDFDWVPLENGHFDKYVANILKM